MENDAVVIKFSGVSDEEANKYAGSLADDLREISGLKAQPARDNPATMDFGATLVLILGTASVTAVARGIQIWLSRQGTVIDIETPNGKAILKNVDSKQAGKLGEALSKKTP